MDGLQENNKWKDKCPKCSSQNTKRDYIKSGMFVSYWNLICKDCGYVEQQRG